MIHDHFGVRRRAFFVDVDESRVVLLRVEAILCILDDRGGDHE